MKVWEAIQMLEAMDQNKEVTVTFGKQTKVMEPQYNRDYVIGKDQWVDRTWPSKMTVTCGNTQLQ